MLLCEGVHEVDLYYDYDTLENMTLVIGFIMRRIFFFCSERGRNELNLAKMLSFYFLCLLSRLIVFIVHNLSLNAKSKVRLWILSLKHDFCW